jgi:hypothetical protein
MQADTFTVFTMRNAKMYLRNTKRYLNFNPIGRNKTLLVLFTAIMGLASLIEHFLHIPPSINVRTKILSRELLTRSETHADFVTFAFTAGAGGRWDSESCKRALRLTYSSLVRSQSKFPRLHVYTDDLTVVPKSTVSGIKTNIVVHQSRPDLLPVNQYTGTNPWLSLSRAKLDVVADLMALTGRNIIWIDLDTLVLVDLSLTNTHSWVIGYQHGNCFNCSAEHISQGGPFDRPIEPKFDIFGDLWALNLSGIAAFRRYEAKHVLSGLPLPSYDLQGYFSLMLADSALPAILLHDVLDYNFGFVCSGFDHPTPQNMRLTVVKGTLSCPVEASLEKELSERVGSISFTSPTFVGMVLKEPIGNFTWVENEHARAYLQSWFTILADKTNSYSLWGLLG